MIEQLPPETITAALVAWTLARISRVESQLEELAKCHGLPQRKRKRWRAAALVVAVGLLVLFAGNSQRVREAVSKLGVTLAKR
jgi:predicted RecB family endonuclease